MAVITISVNDQIEQEFRTTVKQKIGENKGALGKGVEEAMQKWVSEEKQKKISERQMLLMKKGVYTLKGWKFNREEVYER